LKFFNCENLRILPQGIQQLSSLQSLELEWCNGISALPEWLRNISSLKRLAIRYCEGIKSLPPCIQQLTNLQKLVVAKNGKLQPWCELEENKAKLAHINSIVSSRPNCIYPYPAFKFLLYNAVAFFWGMGLSTSRLFSASQLSSFILYANIRLFVFPFSWYMTLFSLAGK